MNTVRKFAWLTIAATTMFLSGCSGTRIEPHHGGGGQPQPQPQPQPQVQPTECAWGLQYDGRNDGQEVFQFDYRREYYFILRTITDADFNKYYDGDIKTFIDKEVAVTLQQAEKQQVDFKDLNEVFNKTVKTFYSGILIHGDYTGYLIEMDASGKPTYNYSKATVVVVEEVATPVYQAWLGEWNIGDKYLSYDIVVSPLENNYLYRVDGWETGPAAMDIQMDQDDDWIETRLMDDGTMSFFIQFIAEYEDYEDLGTVDFLFVGTYTESTGLKVDDWEGWEIARAEDDGENVTVYAGNSEFTDETTGEVFKPAFHTMRYFLYSYGKEMWYPFHTSVPKFPMKMERTGVRSSGIDRTPVHTRNYVRRTQPRASKKSVLR